MSEIPLKGDIFPGSTATTPLFCLAVFGVMVADGLAARDDRVPARDLAELVAEARMGFDRTYHDELGPCEIWARTFG